MEFVYYKRLTFENDTTRKQVAVRDSDMHILQTLFCLAACWPTCSKYSVCVCSSLQFFIYYFLLDNPDLSEEMSSRPSMW